jgi:hypothetical protein
MKKFIFITLLTLLNSSVYSQDVNLDRSGVIYNDEVEGVVDVFCGNKSWHTYRCYESYLRGGDYGRVVVTNGTIDADYVKLQRSGSKYIKSAKFNSKTGKSTGHFNLWIRTLFQRAMLKPGINEINFTFTKKKQEVTSGQFSVEVLEGDTRSCQRGSVHSRECPSPDQSCREYFRKYNYCR